MRSDKVTFAGSRGTLLAGRLDIPDEQPQPERIRRWDAPLLVTNSPYDATVGIDDARARA